MTATVLFAALAQWISVMPLNEGNAASIADQSVKLAEETHVDGIVFSCMIRPEGDPVTDKAAQYVKRYREAEPLIRAKSKVKVGILLQATVGHGGAPDPDLKMQTVVKPNGQTFLRMCPLDPKFIGYIADQVRQFDALKPDFFMVDDDTRMVLAGNDDPHGCFCPLHLAELERRIGRRYGREELVKALRDGEDGKLVKAWDDLYFDSLMGLFRTIRENFSPEVSGEICTVDDSAHLRHVYEFAKALASPGERPAVRLNGAPYHGYDMFHIVDLRSRYAQDLDVFRGQDCIFMQEHDTCPHTLWSCSAVRQYDHMVMLALDGMKGAKMWVTRTGNNHEHKSADEFRRLLRENRGIMEWAAKRDFREAGVVIPRPRVKPEFQRLSFAGDFSTRMLSVIGIATRYGLVKPGETAALTAGSAKWLTKADLEELLAGRLIVDGEAALYLAEQGLGGLMNAKIEKWEGKLPYLHETEGGVMQKGITTGGPLVRISDYEGNGKELTRLYRVPRMGAKPEYAAPGSVLVKTKAGGDLLIMAQTLSGRTPHYNNSALMNETMQEQMLRWLTRLGGGVPGGVAYTGVGHTQLLAGTTAEDGFVFVLNQLAIDDIARPTFRFDKLPKTIERLGKDGKWSPAAFSADASGEVSVNSEVRPQQPAIFKAAF